MVAEAARLGAGDRTETVLQLAPPAAPHRPTPAVADRDDSARWLKRFLNGEYDRWMSAKRVLNIEEDHVIVKVLLDLFQSHGGFSSGAAPDAGPPVGGCQLTNWEAAPPPADRPSGQDEPDSQEDTAGFGASPSWTDGPDGTTSQEEAARPATSGRTRLQNGHRGALKTTRATPVVKAETKTEMELEIETETETERPPPELPSVDPQLMPLFSCGLCSAGNFPSLAAHFQHLWVAHTELRMLGSAHRRRVPLKLRPHMFVLCALCGLNNRSTSTAGAADQHLTRAHLQTRHRPVLQASAAGPLRFDCDQCDARCGSRAELALHSLDAGHECPEFVCRTCGEDGEGAANARHHRLWHCASMPFQCYLCAERFATEPECVAHVRAEHAASFNVHRCARCPYATSIVGQFIAHARSHVGLNTCVCHECGVVFQTAQSLRRHLMTHAHSEFRCRHCNKSFRHPLPLERHVRSQHVSPEDHKCGVCGKLFSSRYHLERHALIHSGRRPHQCDKCGRGFVQKGDLARHVRKCRAGDAGDPLGLQPPPPPPPPMECPPPPIAPPPPQHSMLSPMPPPPLQPSLQSVMLQSPPPTLAALPLSAQGAG